MEQSELCVAFSYLLELTDFLNRILFSANLTLFVLWLFGILFKIERNKHCS